MDKYFEKIKAKQYYGSHSVGTVFLINGQPHHTLGNETREYEKKLLDSGYKNIDVEKEEEKKIAKKLK